MKGNPAEPKCGFSRKMIALLQEAGLDFGTFDILEDQVKSNAFQKDLKSVILGYMVYICRNWINRKSWEVTLGS